MNINFLYWRYLPDINGAPPSCKVVILYDNTIMAKSVVIPVSNEPHWLGMYLNSINIYYEDAEYLLYSVH